MANNPPLVSAIIPAYNQDTWLPYALESVLRQTYRQYEVIVVNDGSTDQTSQILKSYGERVHVITQPNAGLSAARNSGLRVARGDVIGFLDSDDIWYPDGLATAISTFQTRPDVDLVCGRWDLINEKGLPIGPVSKVASRRTNVDTEFLRSSILGCMFPVNALFVRRKCFDCCGLFDISLKAMEDWDLWLRFAAHGHRIGFVDTPVAGYRRHSSSMTLNLPRMERSFQQVLEKAFSNKIIAERCADLNIHSQIFQWIYLAQYCQEAGEEEYLRHCIQKASDLLPRAPYNGELALRYFFLASHIPLTEYFVRMLATSDPKLKPHVSWFFTKVSLKKKEYRIALMELFNLLSNYPMWAVRRTLRKLINVLYLS